MGIRAVLAIRAVYAAAMLTFWITVPDACEAVGLPAVLFITFHVSRVTFELTKFGRPAMYRMWSGWLFAALLTAGLVYGFAVGQSTALLDWAFCVGMAHELEGFAVSAILPAWRADVPSVWHAMKLS